MATSTTSQSAMYSTIRLLIRTGMALLPLLLFAPRFIADQLRVLSCCSKFEVGSAWLLAGLLLLKLPPLAVPTSLIRSSMLRSPCSSRDDLEPANRQLLKGGISGQLTCYVEVPQKL